VPKVKGIKLQSPEFAQKMHSVLRLHNWNSFSTRHVHIYGFMELKFRAWFRFFI
jgi:hypothetical protein